MVGGVLDEDDADGEDERHAISEGECSLRDADKDWEIDQKLSFLVALRCVPGRRRAR